MHHVRLVIDKRWPNGFAVEIIADAVVILSYFNFMRITCICLHTSLGCILILKLIIKNFISVDFEQLIFITNLHNKTKYYNNKFMHIRNYTHYYLMNFVVKKTKSNVRNPAPIGIKCLCYIQHNALKI